MIHPKYDTEDSDIVFGENALVCFSKYWSIYFSPWSLTFSYQSILTCRKKRLKDEKLDVMVLKGEGIAYWDMGYHLTGHFLIVWGENIVFDCLNFGFLVTLYSLGKTLQSCERNLNNCWAETFILECFSMNFDTWL